MESVPVCTCKEAMRSDILGIYKPWNYIIETHKGVRAV